jgi:hypothetical protein
MKTHPVLEALNKAVEGLLYISETESPLEPFLWEGDLSPDRLRKEAGVAKGTSIEEAPLESFFRTVSAEDQPKFAKLAQVLKELTAVKVYKIGDEAEKAVYVVGKTKDGKWAGVKTSVVET